MAGSRTIETLVKRRERQYDKHFPEIAASGLVHRERVGQLKRGIVALKIVRPKRITIA
jgi:hypothetical protein